MEPRREEQKAPQPGAEQKPRRFRIVKLEERIAPSKVVTGKCTKLCGTQTCFCVTYTCQCNPTLINTCGGCGGW